MLGEDMKNKIRNQLLGGAMATGLLVSDIGLLSAAPAQASVWNCGGGYACDWEDGGYSGPMWAHGGSRAVYPSGWDDRTSSIANHSRRTAQWFLEPNWAGLTWRLSAGDAAELGGGVWNDAISSFAF